MPGGPLSWGSILVRSVRFGPFWDFGAGGPFWGSIFRGLVFGPPLASGGFGFGSPLASGASVLDLLWFWTGGSFLDVLLRVRAWTFAPYHFRIPLYMFQVIKPSPICWPSFRFPIRPPQV